MAQLKKIVVLLHEDDPYPNHPFHMIWALRERWEMEGIEVEIAKGVERAVEADLIFPHVDLTITPDHYSEYLARYPCVVNRDVRDISKRAISEDFVQPGDPYSGAVIVKTNRNCGGKPEQWLRHLRSRRGRLGRLRSALRRVAAWNTRHSLRTAKTLDPNDYPIFPSIDHVPPGVFENEALVVQRFLPEREGELYCLRVYVFLGDRYVSRLCKSTEPIVKRNSIVSQELAPVPEEITTARRRLGFDYGKFDYVVCDGQVVLFDVNRTPVAMGLPERQRRREEILAEGIESFL
jgi:hypothetical protein